jgi:hypothetical protein
MIVYYGGNGMSEALFLLTLVGATRCLIRFLTSAETSSLVKAGVWLAFAYLGRSEAVAAIGFSIVVVLGASFLGAAGPLRHRLRLASADAAILGLPSMFAFLAWAAVSFLIVGHPFEQFASQYGTASQLNAMTAVGFKLANQALLVRMVILTAPMLGIASAVAILSAVRRRDLRPLAPLAILGGVLAFAVAAYLKGQTAGWFRYYITAAPLTVLMAGFAVAPSTAASAKAKTTDGKRRLRQWGRGAGALAAVAFLVGPSIIGESVAMADPTIAQEEYLHLDHAFRPAENHARLQSGKPDFHEMSLREMRRYPTSLHISRYLDKLHLPDGSIVTDTFSPCVPFIVLSSRHPKQFVITNDRDFRQILESPATFEARYLLAPRGGNLVALDEVNHTYPALSKGGADVADLAKTFEEVGCPTFGLYAVRPPS